MYGKQSKKNKKTLQKPPQKTQITVVYTKQRIKNSDHCWCGVTVGLLTRARSPTTHAWMSLVTNYAVIFTKANDFRIIDFRIYSMSVEWCFCFLFWANVFSTKLQHSLDSDGQNAATSLEISITKRGTSLQPDSVCFTSLHLLNRVRVVVSDLVWFSVA